MESQRASNHKLVGSLARLTGTTQEYWYCSIYERLATVSPDLLCRYNVRTHADLTAFCTGPWGSVGPAKTLDLVLGCGNFSFLLKEQASMWGLFFSSPWMRCLTSIDWSRVVSGIQAMDRYRVAYWSIELLDDQWKKERLHRALPPPFRMWPFNKYQKQSDFWLDVSSRGKDQEVRACIARFCIQASESQSWEIASSTWPGGVKPPD